MAVFTRQTLSASANGRPIAVAATSTPGTTIHTAVAGAAAFDEVYLWASNVTNAVATLTIEWGGVSDPGDHLVKGFVIQANSGPVMISPGLVLQGSVVLKAFGGTASAINITGYVNRIQ